MRLKGESDNTNKAWIALYCASCNNSKAPQKVSKGSWIVATTMSEAHNMWCLMAGRRMTVCVGMN